MGSLAVPYFLFAVPPEFLGFQYLADSLRGFLIESDLNGVVLCVICDGVAVLAGGGLGLGLYFNCCSFCNSFLNCFGFLFGFCCGCFGFCNYHFFCCHCGLVILNSLYRHLVEHLYNVLHIAQAAVNLFLECVCLSGRILCQAVEVVLQLGDKLLQLIQQGFKHILVLLCKLLNKAGLGEHISHGLCHNFPAGHVVAHGLAVFIHAALSYFSLYQISHILSALCEFLENKGPKLIIFSCIVLFNEMHKFMVKSSQHCVFLKRINAFDAFKAGVYINIDGVLFPLK